MLDDCIAVALGLPQLKILWQQARRLILSKYQVPEEIRRQNKQDRRLRDKVVFLTLVKRYLIRVVDS